jgi:hypothetical protein
MMRSYAILSSFLLASACVTAPRATPSHARVEDDPVQASCQLGDLGADLRSSAQEPAPLVLRRLGSGVDPYRLQDGVWLSHAPVMVNEPFDFAQAMGLGAIGAGLAAANRQKHNRERAEQWSARELSPQAVRHLDALRACGILRWVLLWDAGEKAETHVVTERYDPQGQRLETRERVIAGDAAFAEATWLGSADDGEPVRPAEADDEPVPPPP